MRCVCAASLDPREGLGEGGQLLRLLLSFSPALFAFQVAGPLSVWHGDGHEKLFQKYGFYVSLVGGGGREGGGDLGVPACPPPSPPLSF